MSDIDFTPTATGAGLVAFLDYAIQKGYLKTATGQAMKTAVKEVLSATEGADGWETVDLTSLDEDDVLRRFETLRAMKFSSGSLSTYKGRYSRAAAMFEEFRASPATWRPSVKQRSRSKGNGASTSAAPESSKTDSGAPSTPAPPPGPSAPHPGHGSAIITYPFPLRQGVLASVELPPDLTRREARRLAAFIEALAIEDEVAEPVSLPPEPPDDPRD
ncbi:MAG: hypothetical protein IT195_00180 [Microthrixaceae bacterium]|nr:hypothetical protein [Microthrixaceae bacterium]